MGQMYTARQGDWLSKIAARFDFARWETIFNAPENEAFRARRPNPNLIRPGDQIFIPDKTARGAGVPTGGLYNFRLRETHERLRVVVPESAGHPAGSRRYRLVAGATYEGALPSSGVIDHAIPRDLDEAHLTVWLNDDGTEHHWTLKVGHLDPIDEPTGIQARLNNLGFSCGPVDGVAGPRTRRAIRDFQRRHGLKMDGVAGPITRARLREVYGS